MTAHQFIVYPVIISIIAFISHVPRLMFLIHILSRIFFCLTIERLIGLLVLPVGFYTQYTDGRQTGE